MMKLPIEVHEKIDSRQQIAIALRTPKVNLIGPFTTTINRTLTLFFIARWAVLAGVDNDWRFYLGAFTLWCIMALRPIWFDVVKWRRDLYVVTRDTTNLSQKGRIYHIQGDIAIDLRGRWKHEDDPITAIWPSFSTEKPVHFNIWRWLTGEDMEQVLLDDPGHNVQISSKAISPKFRKTISRIQGETPRDRETHKGPPDVVTAHAIRDAYADDLLNEDEARGMLKVIFGRLIHGVD